MPRIVALDLGTANVKATVWNMVGRKATFVERLLHPVPQDGAPVGLEPQLIALRALVEDNPSLLSAGTIIAASQGGRHVSVHRLTLPFTDAKQIETTLPFAIEAEVPFDMEDMVLGWRMIRQSDVTEALVGLVEETALRATLDGLAKLRVEPRQVVPDKQLLARWSIAGEPALGTESETAAPILAIIDVGHSRTVVSVARNGELLGARELDIGGADLTRAIQRVLHCSWNNAERLKVGLPAEPDAEPALQVVAEPEPDTDGLEEDTEPDLDVPDVPVTPWDQLPEPGLENLPAAARSAFDQVLSRILAEVRSTLIGFEDTVGDEIIEVMLGGGSARVPGFAGFLQDDLGVTVSWPHDDHGEPVPCEYLMADALAHVMAGEVDLGLVDLRRGSLRWRSGFDAMQATVTYGGALVAFFTLAMLGLYGWQSYSLSTEIVNVQSQIEQTIKTALPGDSVKRPTESMIKMRKRIDEAKARAETLGNDGPPPSVDMLYALSTQLPPPNELEIDVTSMTITPRALNFDAEVASYAAAEQVEVALKETERFKTCTKSNEQQRRGRISFSVQCDFDAASEEG